MGHVREEQFEDILWGGAAVPEHVNWCPRCSARLDEKYLVAHRLSRAFRSIHAGPDLIDRIQAQIGAQPPQTVTRT